MTHEHGPARVQALMRLCVKGLPGDSMGKSVFYHCVTCLFSTKVPVMMLCKKGASWLVGFKVEQVPLPRFRRFISCFYSKTLITTALHSDCDKKLHLFSELARSILFSHTCKFPKTCEICEVKFQGE